ncbi:MULTISPECIES: biotin transporter BioY [unclassified Rathayibacter]|uniref:biotin transporter BioY n=1 Tax=unclassified Rathayibacter TaxID=2609250 RepID=UPI00188B706F|nr:MULTISPECIES: biotin transporter BioY [unclassified Rathayibacter]MBF4462374.1 biotin transporter BioY [Rathayibacter sp. VKM Ac-2879]MBF4503583.1 biotin transporter BioY [Rathayibacter sp. VKM Ac-2878]
MSSSALVPSHPVLADRILSRSVATDVALVIGGAALTAGMAQISIPMWPVPITGQTLAVLLVGSALGAVRGASSLALYLVLGLVGLPVYAPQSDGSHLSGLTAVATPSFGYIIGFVLAAGVVGWLSERSWERRFFKALATFVGGSLVVFAVGLPWLSASLHSFGYPSDIDATLAAGFWPFVVGGIVKAVIAAAILPLAWRGADAIAERRR